MAIMTRWRMPPDSSCGYWLEAPPGLGDADLTAAGRRPGSCAASAVDARGGGAADSVICVPIRLTGLSEVIGSWKTMAISVPQKCLALRVGEGADVAALEADRAARRHDGVVAGAGP